MCPEWTGPGGEDPDDGSPPDRPYGTKPYGTKPYGTKPYGTKPYGTKPYGTKPYGTKPYGTKPYGTKPYGTKSDDPDFLDPDEWGEDVADLFCGSSALVRLGARIVVDGGDLPVPAIEFDLSQRPDYLKQPKSTKPDQAPQLKFSKRKPVAQLSQRHLSARDHELAVSVAIPNHLVQALVEYPEIAWALKQDLARALALRADQAFLHGGGGRMPVGIVGTAGVAQLGPPVAPATPNDLLRFVRRMVGDLRRLGPQVQWGHAGWILHPDTLDGLSRLLTQTFQFQLAPGWGLEPGLVFTHDGNDGGVLFGYPFVVSAATFDPGSGAGNPAWTRIYLSSDWSETWIGADRDLVSIDISGDARFRNDETVIRAVMHHDFVVRRPPYFIYANRQPGIEQVHAAGAGGVKGGVDPAQNP